MAGLSEAFEKNRERYLARLAEADLGAVSKTLGLETENGDLVLPFYNKRFTVTNRGFVDTAGQAPGYGQSVVLFQYILRCPEAPRFEPDWAAFKDFKKASHFTNVNFFHSDTEQAVERTFSGRAAALAEVGAALGGVPYETATRYDVSMKFQALPRIALLLLFNDADEEFPAKCTVLFERHAEHYLDPESLAMTSTWLARSLAGRAG